MQDVDYRTDDDDDEKSQMLMMETSIALRLLGKRIVRSMGHEEELRNWEFLKTDLSFTSVVFPFLKLMITRYQKKVSERNSLENVQHLNFVNGVICLYIRICITIKHFFRSAVLLSTLVIEHLQNTILKCSLTDKDLIPLFQEAKILFQSSECGLTNDHKLAFITNYISCLAEHSEKFPESLNMVIALTEFLESPEKIFQEYFNNDSMLNPLIRQVKRIAEELDLTNCPTDICRQQSETSVEQNGHYLAKLFLKITFSVRTQFPEAFKDMKNCILKAHEYKKSALKACFEMEDIFDEEFKVQLVDEFEGLLPKHETMKSTGEWCNDNFGSRFFKFLSVFMNIQDFALDCTLCCDYYDFKHFLSENNYLCSSSTNSGNSTLTTTGSVFSSTISENHMQTAENVTDCFEVTPVVNLDTLLPFWYAFTILAMTLIFQGVLVLKEKNGIFKNLIYYLSGSCCTGRRLSYHQEWKKLIVTCFVALLLPFVSRIVVSVRMAAKHFQFIKNSEIYYILKKENHTLKSNFPKRQKDHDCFYCKNCTNLQCMCFYCGFVSEKFEHSVTSNQYQERLQEMQRNMLRLETVDRYFTITLEDTYMPLLQCFLVIPLLVKHFADDVSQNTNEVKETVAYYATIIFHVWSILTSILGHSNDATDLYFKRLKKANLGTKLAPRLLYQLSTLLIITSRLTTIVVFGITVLPGDSLVPLYLVLMCFSHILVVCAMRYLIALRHLPKGSVCLSNTILDSFASTYVNVKGTFRVGSNDINGTNSKNIREKYEQRQNELWAKFCERLVFCYIIWSEQLVMMAVIGYNSDTQPFLAQFNGILFLSLSSTCFLLGHLCEWVLHVHLNTFAELREAFLLKKKLLNGIMAWIVLVILIVLPYVTYTYHIFVPIVVIEVIVVLTVLTLSFKKIHT